MMVGWKIVEQGRSCIVVVLHHVMVKDDVKVIDVVNGMVIGEGIGEQSGLVIGNLG